MFWEKQVYGILKTLHNSENFFSGAWTSGSNRASLAIWGKSSQKSWRKKVSLVVDEW
jgi:hypothetical protein